MPREEWTRLVSAWGTREDFPEGHGQNHVVTLMGPKHFRLPGPLPPLKHLYILENFMTIWVCW